VIPGRARYGELRFGRGGCDGLGSGPDWGDGLADGHRHRGGCCRGRLSRPVCGVAADERVAAERAHSAQVLAEERKLADERLARQLEHSDAQVLQERNHAIDSEQHAPAWAVEIEPGAVNAGGETGDTFYMTVLVSNLGTRTITQVEAQFSSDGKSLVTMPGSTEVLQFLRQRGRQKLHLSGVVFPLNDNGEIGTGYTGHRHPNGTSSTPAATLHDRQLAMPGDDPAWLAVTARSGSYIFRCDFAATPLTGVNRSKVRTPLGEEADSAARGPKATPQGRRAACP
jgi:hypothetical protein